MQGQHVEGHSVSGLQLPTEDLMGSGIGDEIGIDVGHLGQRASSKTIGVPSMKLRGWYQVP